MLQFVFLKYLLNIYPYPYYHLMTKGGPDNASSLLLYYIYEVGFKFWDSAYASALTVVLLAILATAAVAQFVFLEKRTHYQ